MVKLTISDFAIKGSKAPFTVGGKMKEQTKAKASKLVRHIVCAQEGCFNVRQSADQSEWKEYCVEHIEQMPYVQQIYSRIEQLDPIQDKEDAEDALEEMLKELIHNK